MKHLVSTTCFVILLAIIGVAPVGANSLPYSDMNQTHPAATAVSMLTDQGILKGNFDGSFTPDRYLNRAEFVTIAMRAEPIEFRSDDVTVDVSCFPDVMVAAWYTYDLCKAKALGFVSGNKFSYIEPGQWPFQPSRAVQYQEALKILVEVFRLEKIPTGGEWYQTYVNAAESYNLQLDEMKPGQTLSRGQMARLTARFKAYADDQLSEFLAAERNGDLFGSQQSASSSVISSVVSSSSTSSSESSVSTSSATSSVTYDPMSDTSVAPGFLLLGTTSSILGSVEIFSDTQPIYLDNIYVTLNTKVTSIDELLIYDENKVFLGRATVDSAVPAGNQYKASVRTKDIYVAKREGYSIYARARLKGDTVGGVSGEDVRISQFTIEGEGAWNNQNISQSSSDTFSDYETASARITDIEGLDDGSQALIAGTNESLGRFRFSGEAVSGTADLYFTDLDFTLGLVGGTSVANAYIKIPGTANEHSCTATSTNITCSSIPESFGTFEDSPLTIELFADITDPGTSQNASVQANLNQPGSISSAGAITWTDGTTSFSWVPFGAPIARGPYLNR